MGDARPSSVRGFYGFSADLYDASGVALPRLATVRKGTRLG